MGGKCPPPARAGEERSNPEPTTTVLMKRYTHFTATFNEGTTNLPMLISCQTNYSNITRFVLLIARISHVIDSQRTILPAAFHHCCQMLSTSACYRRH